MSRNIQLLVMMCVLTVPWHLANAQTTSPATGGVGLEQRATQLYNTGDYASALPLLQTLAAKFKDQPDQLSIVQEKIRFCQRKLAAANLNNRDKTTQPATAPATVPAAARQPPRRTQRRASGGTGHQGSGQLRLRHGQMRQHSPRWAA